MLLEVVVYAGLISAMPRAGGDYVWQSRVFHSSVGFVLGATGWWFILWLWIPIYAALCVNSFIKPILRIVGAGGAANWLGTPQRRLCASLATIALATYLVAVGMKAYATFQKWALWIGLAGIAVAGVILLVTSKAGFINAFNRESLHLYGAHNAYAATIKNSGAGMPSSMFAARSEQTVQAHPGHGLLAPVAELGRHALRRGPRRQGLPQEHLPDGRRPAVRGGDRRRLPVPCDARRWASSSSMASANGYMGVLYGYIKSTPHGGDYLSPTAMIAWVVHNSALQVILIAAISLLVFGWWGTVFLSSTRMIFASAFDRILPEGVAKVTSGGVPVWPCCSWSSRRSSCRPSTPTSPRSCSSPTTPRCASPSCSSARPGLHGHAVAHEEHLGQLGAAQAQGPGPADHDDRGRAYSAFMVFNLYLWIYDTTNTYGIGYKNKNSMIFMGILYVAAIVVWVVAWAVRKRQGMALEAVAKEIPVE